MDEPQAWIITYAQDYTLYAFHSREYKTTQGMEGQLQICLFFPPQRQLGRGKSPLALLDSILDLFAVLGMPEGQLPAEPLDNAPFRSLLRNLPLEDSPVLLPIMQGGEVASYCVENVTQLDALMRDSRYVMTGRHNKANYRIRYEDLKALGYRSLVHEFYASHIPGKVLLYK